MRAIDGSVSCQCILKLPWVVRAGVEACKLRGL